MAGEVVVLWRFPGHKGKSVGVREGWPKQRFLGENMMSIRKMGPLLEVNDSLVKRT